MDEKPVPDTLDTGGPRETTDQKLDTLSTSVDKRFDAVDKRFDAVDKRFDAVDERFDAVDERFRAVDEALVEQRQYTEFAFGQLATEMKAGFDKVDGRFSKVEGRFNRFERKLDQFIDTQAKTNELVERRLQGLEPKPGRT